MTMRLDIVTNDAGELVRREHARELGANVVIAIYRLAKLAQMHDLQNQAFTRQLEQTHQIVSDYCLRAGFAINVLFADRAVFVAGQLLKGSRGVYEAAQELGAIFERLGGSELFIDRGLTREELAAFAEQISLGFRSGAGSFRSPTPKIRLRPVNEAARLRGLELENLTGDQRIVRTYASAVVIMRRFFEDLQASKYVLPRRIKRIAQSLVDLAEGSTPSYLGVTEVRNANFDEAGRAVNTAILAVSMAREVTQDRAILAQIAMAAMMHDVARPRALALASAGGAAMPGMQGPSVLSEDQEDRLPAGTAAVLTALGRVNEPSITRTVLTFEALWLRRQTWLGPVYWGARQATLHARMIAVARRYNDLLTPEPGLVPPTPDYAVARLSEELKDPLDRAVLRMLVSALGLLPTGTVVQLNTGETAEVVRGPKGPGERPRVRLVADERGAPLAQPIEIELAQDPRRQVARILGVDGWRKGLEQGPAEHGPGQGGYDPDAAPAYDGRASDAPAPASFAAVPPPALPPISPLSPVALPPAGAAAPPSRSRADQYADKFATWGNVEEPVPTPEASEPPPRRDSTTSSIQSGEHNSSASLPSLGSSPSAVAEAMGRMINDSLRPPAPVTGDRAVLSQGSEEGPGGRAPNRQRAASTREPTARGNLAATPLPHVLVYMLDHALTGSVIFESTGEGDDAIYFVGGVPSKIRLRDPVGLLGEMLVQGEFLEPKAVDQAVEGARRLGILLGEYLVGHDLASREAVAWALEAQVLHKIAHIANLPPELSYAYYRDLDILEGWGGGDVPMSAPLNPILASVRNWMDRARVRATLNRIGKHPLVLHHDSDLSNLALLPEEQQTLELITSESLSLPQLFKRNIADEEIVSSLIYALAVTRQFAFKGQKKGPMAAGGIARAQPAPSASAKASSQPSPPVSGAVPSEAAPTASSSQAKAAFTSSLREMPQAAAAGVSARPGTAAAATTATATAPAGGSARPTAGAASRAQGAGPASGAALPRASPPQIRPIVQKKATVVGLQPAVPADARAPSPDDAEAAASSAAGKTPSMGPVDDNARTIAMPTKALFENMGKKKLPSSSPAPMPRAGSSPGIGPPSAAGGRPAGMSRPPPGLPSKLAPPKSRSASPPGAKAPPATAAKAHEGWPKPTPSAVKPDADDGRTPRRDRAPNEEPDRSADSTDEIDVDLDDPSS